MPDARFLVVFDADSTLLRNEVIELIADEAGRGAEDAVEPGARHHLDDRAHAAARKVTEMGHQQRAGEAAATLGLVDCDRKDLGFVRADPRYRKADRLAAETQPMHQRVALAEHGLEQLARDARITTLYEGTTGIQAIDLMARKIARDGGAAAQRVLRTLVDGPVEARVEQRRGGLTRRAGQIGPQVPLLRCPVGFDVTLFAGGRARDIDIPSLCHAWVPIGTSLADATAEELAVA